MPVPEGWITHALREISIANRGNGQLGVMFEPSSLSTLPPFPSWMGQASSQIMQMAHDFEHVYLPAAELSNKGKKSQCHVNEVITLMIWRKKKVLRGTNEGNCKWVQIKHQLNIASQALVIVRKKKSLTVAFLGNKLAYTVHWFSNHVTRTRAIGLLEENNCSQGHKKKQSC